MEHQKGYIFMYFKLQLQCYTHLHQTQMAQQYRSYQKMKFIQTQVTLSQYGGSFKFCVKGHSYVL